MTINVPIPWREVLTDEAAHTITGDVRIIDAFQIPQLQTERRVWIYLPKSYNKGVADTRSSICRTARMYSMKRRPGEASGPSTKRWSRWR
ncbi:hypothetical protein [Paenibacillus catalpae]|uniref:hypothetical protein n=1 Tax=Paenibacillus catalpae TaxID=1045775 RepID=UPI000AA2D096|nr:hypothetical protein [Paenibacillus catalpae]